MEFLGAKVSTGAHPETSAETSRERAGSGERKPPKTTGFTYTVVCNVKASWRACHMQDTLIETEMDHNCTILCPGNCSE